MGRTSFLVLAILALALTAGRAARAQEDDSDAGSGRSPGRPSAAVVQARQKLSGQAEKSRLEALKKARPELYEKQMEASNRQKKISDILAQSSKGEMDKEEAKRKLLPLVKPLVAPELDGLDRQIELQEKRLDFLRRVKRNPDLLAERRVEEMLGQRKPDPAEFGR